MKVKELIELLEKLDQERPICIVNNNGKHKSIENIESDLHHWDYHKLYVIK